MRPPDEDRLAAARAADALNRSLDDARHRDTPAPGDRELDAAVRRINEIAATNVPAHVIRSAEDRLWEDLMQRHTTTAPTPGTVATSIESSAEAADLRWQPRIARPAGRPARIGHRIGHRVMGLVATLTIVALIGLSGLAVYLNIPERGGEPTSMAAVGIASPVTTVATVVPTPVRADATVLPNSGPFWSLPNSAYEELPAAETFGDGWHTFPSVSLVQQPGTSFQIETRYYVNNDGGRMRVMFVRYVDDAQFSEAYDYFADEIRRYQDTMYFNDSTARSERLEEPLDGCERTARAEGQEWVTSFPVWATLCQSANPHIVMLVSLSGDLAQPEYPLFPQRSDAVVTDVINYMNATATPVATP